MISRRELLAASGVLLARPFSIGEGGQEGFRIAHLTDLHMRDRNRAQEGIRMAVDKVLSLNPRPDLVFLGGDLGDGLMASDEARARALFSMLEEELKRLEMTVHAVVGNHDVYGWGQADGPQNQDAHYGKSLFAEKFIKGPLYRRVDYKGWRFFLLDSIQPAPSGAKTPYESRIDQAQFAWLKSELEALGTTPATVVTHSPLLTGYFLYNDGPYKEPSFRMVIENAKELHELMVGKNVKVVLQGHTHVAENLHYAGRQHITSGAVSGSWWAGPRFGIDPNGFSVLDLTESEAKWAYVPTGFQAGG